MCILCFSKETYIIITYIISFISILVQYLAYLHQFFKEWRKNSTWSFSCCLALLVPLNDLQGEIRGIVGKNMLKTQLQSGVTGKPSIAASAKDSGALSFSSFHEDSRRRDDSEKSRVTKNGNTKCDRGTNRGISSCMWRQHLCL